MLFRSKAAAAEEEEDPRPTLNIPTKVAVAESTTPLKSTKDSGSKSPVVGKGKGKKKGKKKAAKKAAPKSEVEEA